MYCGSDACVTLGLDVFDSAVTAYSEVNRRSTDHIHKSHLYLSANGTELNGTPTAWACRPRTLRKILVPSPNSTVLEVFSHKYLSLLKKFLGVSDTVPTHPNKSRNVTEVRANYHRTGRYVQPLLSD